LLMCVLSFALSMIVRRATPSSTIGACTECHLMES
jgi:hypothetical protein